MNRDFKFNLGGIDTTKKISMMRGKQLSQIRQIQRMHDSNQTIKENNWIGYKNLMKQQHSNYKNEYDRLRNEISNTNISALNRKIGRDRIDRVKYIIK